MKNASHWFTANFTCPQSFHQLTEYLGGFLLVKLLMGSLVWTFYTTCRLIPQRKTSVFYSVFFSLYSCPIYIKWGKQITHNCFRKKWILLLLYLYPVFILMICILIGISFMKRKFLICAFAKGIQQNLDYQNYSPCGRQ